MQDSRALAVASRALRATEAPAPAVVAQDAGPVRLPPFRVLVPLTLGFALLAAAISLAHGVPLPWPSERINPALGFHAAWPLAIAFAAYLVLRLIQLARVSGSRRRLLAESAGDCAFLLLFAVASYFHFLLKLELPILRSGWHDALYMALDRRFAGLLAVMAELRRMIAAFLPRADLWYQGSQIGIYLLSFWGHSLGERRWYPCVATAFLLNIILGPLAYALAPAVGPFVFEHGPNLAADAAQGIMGQIHELVRTQGAAWLARHAGEHLTAAPAAMPSLHLSAACIGSYFALRARLRVAWLILPMAAWIALEAVVARWHYLVDLPAGALFAALVIALSHLIAPPASGN